MIGRVEDVVKSSEGTILESGVWGKRRLAYEVKKYTEGIYVKINFDAVPVAVEKLREHFRFNEDVIRDLIVQQEYRQSQRHKTEASAPASREADPGGDEEPPSG